MKGNRKFIILWKIDRHMRKCFKDPIQDILLLVFFFWCSSNHEYRAATAFVTAAYIVSLIIFYDYDKLTLWIPYLKDKKIIDMYKVFIITLSKTLFIHLDTETCIQILLQQACWKDIIEQLEAAKVDPSLLPYPIILNKDPDDYKSYTPQHKIVNR